MVEKRKQINLGGKKYWFTLLNMADFKLLRDETKKILKTSKDETRKKAIAEAKELGVDDPLKLLQYIDTKPITENEIMDAMEMMENLTLMLHLSLKHEYPNMTQAECDELVGQNDLKEITGFLNQEEKEPGIEVDMKTLGHKVELKNGETKTINELIVEANKKKRTRHPVKKK